MHHPDLQEDVKRNQCDTCGKTFACKKSLLLHVASHTGRNVFLCDICGKSVSSMGSLKCHRHLHSGNKPVVCFVCGKAFSGRCSLRILRTSMYSHR